MSLYVVDDHPLMREAVAMLLRRLRPSANVVELDRLFATEAAVQKHGEPELFCLDLKLPDAQGVSGVHLIKGKWPHVPVAVISASPAADFEEAALSAGADVYIEKNAGAREIGDALRGLLQADDDAEELSHADQKLSKRQKQLIALLDAGCSNQDIATRLGISEHTVKVHLWRLYRRLGVKSRTQALHHARTYGLLVPMS